MKKLILTIPILLYLLITTPAYSGIFCQDSDATVYLIWNINTEEDLSHYTVFWGTSSRDYDYSVDTTLTRYVLSDFNSGSYYLAVTATDYTGNESSYSIEIFWDNEEEQDTTPPNIPTGVEMRECISCHQGE